MPMPQLGTMMPHKEREESIPSLQLSDPTDKSAPLFLLFSRRCNSIQ